MAPRVYVAIVPLLLAGLAGFVFVRSESDSGDRFVSSVSRAVVLAPALEAVVRTAPEPVTTRKGGPGRRAKCVRVERFGLKSPWDCTITYASGRRVTYLVLVDADGSYRGGDMRITVAGRTTRSDTGNVAGCCVRFTRLR